MLSPPRPSPPPPPPLPAFAGAVTAAPQSPPAPLSYLSAVHSLIHSSRGISAPFSPPPNVAGKQSAELPDGALSAAFQPLSPPAASSLPPPEWPFSLLAYSLAAATHQPPLAQPPATTHPVSASPSPTAASAPSGSSGPLSARHSPSLTAGDGILRSYLRSPRSSVGQCVSWLMAAEHRVILHTTATFYTQTQQQHQPAHPAGSRPTGKPTSAAARRAAQQQSAALGSEVKVAEMRQPLLLGVGPGSADSNAPRNGEVIVANEQSLTSLRPHASSLWLQPARLSRQLAAYLSGEKVGLADQSAATPVMSSVTAVPIDVWADVCRKHKAGDTAALSSLLGVEKVVSLSQLSRLLAAHIQPLPPPSVIPASALTPSAAGSPMLATMQLMAANRAAAAAAGQSVNGSAVSFTGPTGNPAPYTHSAGSSQPSHTLPPIDVPTARRGFMAAMQLSAPLSRLLGHRFLSRPSVVRHLWNYIRSHNLQRATEKRIIDCDPPLQAIMGTRSVTMFEMNTFLTQHLTIVKEADADWIAANREAQEVEDADRKEDERTGKKKAGDGKKKGETAAAIASARRRERDRALKERRRLEKEDSKRGRPTTSATSSSSSSGSSRSKRDRDRDREREASEKRKRQKKRRKEDDALKQEATSEDEEGEQRETSRTAAAAAAVVAAAAAAEAGGEREEATDDDSNATDDDKGEAEAETEAEAEAGAEADGDLSTQSEASSGGSDEDDEEAEEEEAEQEDDATDENAVLEVSRTSQADEEEDDDTGQSADEIQDDEDDGDDNDSSAMQ